MHISAPKQVIQASSIHEIGRLVRERRRALGMRQADVAQRAGMSRSRLVDIENSNAVEGLSFHKLSALLMVLGWQLAIAVQHEPADVAAHQRNAIRVPAGIKLRIPSIG